MAQGNRTEIAPNLVMNGNLGKSEKYDSVKVLGESQYSTIQTKLSSLSVN